jgi:hypothetical protein
MSFHGTSQQPTDTPLHDHPPHRARRSILKRVDWNSNAAGRERAALCCPSNVQPWLAFPGLRVLPQMSMKGSEHLFARQATASIYCLNWNRPVDVISSRQMPSLTVTMALILPCVALASLRVVLAGKPRAASRPTREQPPRVEVRRHPASLTACACARIMRAGVVEFANARARVHAA